MDVLLVRHAQAGDMDTERWPDDRQRPLTKDGTREFRKIARKLGRLVRRVDALWSSPLVRAVETAEILEKRAEWPRPQHTTLLEPGCSPSDILDALRQGEPRQCVVLVGHEPDLSTMVAVFVTGDENTQIVEMKKGGAALLRFDGEIAAGGAHLAWLLPPRVLVRSSRLRKKSRASGKDAAAAPAGEKELAEPPATGGDSHAARASRKRPVAAS